MKPFRFRAEVVLALRQRQEEAARDEVARCQSALDHAHHLQDERRADLARAASDAAAAQQQGLDAWQLSWHRNWIHKQQRDVDASQQAIAAAETALAQAMAALNLARQKSRVMERLKSRAAQRYQLEVTREDNRTMDAFAAIRYAARQREGDARDD
jgi:flagellar export protein FliJ